MRSANLPPEQIDIVSTHATGTAGGDVQEAAALHKVFQNNPNTLFNNTKSFIGHAMGAAGALELAGNLPSFHDHTCHATINLDDLDPECAPWKDLSETNRKRVFKSSIFSIIRSACWVSTRPSSSRRSD